MTLPVISKVWKANAKTANSGPGSGCLFASTWGPKAQRGMGCLKQAHVSKSLSKTLGILGFRTFSKPQKGPFAATMNLRTLVKGAKALPNHDASKKTLPNLDLR